MSHPTTNPRPSASLKIIILIIILILIAAAAILRCTALNRLDIGTDEAHSFLTAASPDGVLAALQNDTNPPLYFLTLKAWIAIFGTSLTAMRLLSALLGAAAVAAIAALARQCGASWRTTLWALALAAFAPIQLHYAQLARGYTLSYLLLTLGLWSFVYAVQSRRPAAWALHGLIIALSAYSHALLIPITAGYIIAALLMHLKKRQLLAIILTYSIAALLAAPVLFLSFHQARTSGGTAWLRDYWQATPPALAIPKSLALLSLGGNLPRYLLAAPLPWPLQLLGLTLAATAAAAFFWPQKKSSTPDLDQIPRHQWRPLLITFTLFPLLFLWIYSLAVTPIYLVGRYDQFAQPALLILLAFGFSRLQNSLPRIRLLPTTLVALVLAAGIHNRFTIPLDPQIFHHQARAEYLAHEIQPGDTILCTGLEASPTIYWLHQLHINIPVSTFPRETLSHPGWLINDEDIVARRDQWPAEMLAALAAASNNNNRVWILLDSAAWNPPTDNAPSPRQALALSLLPTALAHGYHLAETDPARLTAQANLRFVAIRKNTP